MLKPGGVLRLALPDLDKGIRPIWTRTSDYFLIPDEDARSIGAQVRHPDALVRLVADACSRYDFIAELLAEAGFREVSRCSFRETDSRFPGIVELDSRERESLFVEAIK